MKTKNVTVQQENTVERVQNFDTKPKSSDLTI